MKKDKELLKIIPLIFKGCFVLQTIFIYDSNITLLIATVLVFLLFSLSIIGFIYFFPLLKVSCNYIYAILTKKFNHIYSGVSKFSVVFTIVLTIFIYSLIGVLGFSSGKSLIEEKFIWINKDFSTCDIIDGECENLQYDLVETRYCNYYKCSFTIENIEFSDVEIDEPYEETMKYLNEEYRLNIYYRTINGKNYIVRIDAKI